MKPTVPQIQNALRFFADLPRLLREERLAPDICSRAIDLPALADIARQLGYDATGEAIAEAFRIRMLARQAVATRGQ